MALLYAIITVVAWGTWLAPSQNVRFSGQEVRAFYVTITNLLISAAIAGMTPVLTITGTAFWLAFSGGIVWVLGAWAAFTASDLIGLVRAYGLWAPLNILVSIVLGALAFGEFVSLNMRATLYLVGSLALILCGVLMIIFSRERAESQGTTSRSLALGVISAAVAGVLWATYYIPIKLSNASMWVAAFPMACGMVAGSLLLVVISRKSFQLENVQAYFRSAASGLLWSCGNYGMLLLVQNLGVGKGFTISQLAVVANALCGIYILKVPEPKSRSARLALTGCVLATLGAILIPNAK